MPDAIIVFGASGFIGRNLVARLVAEGRAVYAVTGSGAPVPGARATCALSGIASLGVLPSDCAAVHVGAYRYDSSRFDLVQADILAHNAEMNARIFQWCAERRLSEMRLASSVAVYPAALAVMDDAVPLDFNAPPHAGEAFYAWSKRFAEIEASLYAARFGLNTQIFRLSNPYGPRDSINPAKAHVAPAFVMRALSPDPVFAIRGDASVERDFTFVGDVVEAFVRSLEVTGRNDAYNLCTGETMTLQALAELVLRLAGADKRIEAGAPGAFGPAKRVSTSARIRAAYGLTFTPPAEGFARTIDWYRHALG